jgi:hypothetical protein
MPVVAAVLVLVLAVRVARALLHLLALVVLALGLLWGYGDNRHGGSLDAAARQIAAQVHLGAGDSNTTMPQLLAQAHAALVEAGSIRARCRSCRRQPDGPDPAAIYTHPAAAAVFAGRVAPLLSGGHGRRQACQNSLAAWGETLVHRTSREEDPSWPVRIARSR